MDESCGWFTPCECGVGRLPPARAAPRTILYTTGSAAAIRSESSVSPPGNPATKEARWRRTNAVRRLCAAAVEHKGDARLQKGGPGAVKKTTQKKPRREDDAPRRARKSPSKSGSSESARGPWRPARSACTARQRRGTRPPPRPGCNRRRRRINHPGPHRPQTANSPNMIATTAPADMPLELDESPQSAAGDARLAPAHRRNETRTLAVARPDGAGGARRPAPHASGVVRPRTRTKGVRTRRRCTGSG